MISDEYEYDCGRVAALWAWTWNDEWFRPACARYVAKSMPLLSHMITVSTEFACWRISLSLNLIYTKHIKKYPANAVPCLFFTKHLKWSHDWYTHFGRVSQKQTSSTTTEKGLCFSKVTDQTQRLIFGKCRYSVFGGQYWVGMI